MKSLYAPVAKQEGFTLVEAVIAMAVLALGIMALYTMQINSIANNARASNITIASSWAADKVEELLATPYEYLGDCEDPVNPPTDPAAINSCAGDGTNQDADNDGIDDDGGNFGLDDVTAAAIPDGQEDSPDGNFTVFWNIAVDLPIEGSKTVRIHIQDNNQFMNNMVTVQYIKEGPL